MYTLPSSFVDYGRFKKKPNWPFLLLSFKKILMIVLSLLNLSRTEWFREAGTSNCSVLNRIGSMPYQLDSIQCHRFDACKLVELIRLYISFQNPERFYISTSLLWDMHIVLIKFIKVNAPLFIVLFERIAAGQMRLIWIFGPVFNFVRVLFIG